MSNPYFNDDQNAHMAYLRSRPPESRCWCGWNDAGRCPNGCGGLTLAERIKHECPKCGNYPFKPGQPITHVNNCPAKAMPDTATEKGESHGR